MMALPKLHVRLFGPFELVWGDETLTIPFPPKARSLLAYLIVHHGRSFPRDLLAGTFWPDRPDHRARRALSHTLWQIRRTLGPAADRLVAERDTVTFVLHPDDWLDVAEFESKMQEAGCRDRADISCLLPLASCIRLYRADFLEDIYDDWALLERERLRELYLRALERLITLHKQQGDYEQALTCAQRLAAADPLRESAHRELMRLYHLLGRDQAALEQYATLCQLLEDELGLEPTAATTALCREIAAAMDEPAQAYLPIPPPPPPALRDIGHLPLIGRVGERAALLDIVQAAVQGHGGVALVEGDAGVGKTRLVEEIAADARWRGMLVGWGRAVPDAPPYRPLTDALTPLLTAMRVSQLATLVEPLWLSAVVPLLPSIADHLPDLPALPALEPQRERERMWEGLARCLDGLATIAPLVLILEDLHWADDATLSALPYLVARLRPSRLLILLTCRSIEARERASVWETLEAIDRASPIQRVHLLPFAPKETAALVGRALGITEKVAPFARRLWSATGGNALFLVETLKSLLEQGTLARTSDGSWCFPAPDIPLPPLASLQAVVGGRLARLSSSERAVLELVAVLGEEADFPTLFQSAAEQAVLLPALEKLKRRGFLVETETCYRFEHDRIRETLYQSIAAERRRQLHRQAGAVLERLHPERVEALAYHFSQGEVWDRAVIYNLKAGRQAQAMHAPHAAWEHYTYALEILDTHRPFPEQQAADLAFQARAARRELAWMKGDIDQEKADIEALLQLAARLSDPERRAEALNQQSYFLCNAQDEYEKALQAAQAALALAQEHNLPRQAAIALRNIGQAYHRSGNYREAEKALRQSLATWEAIDETSAQVAEVQIYLAQVYEQTGDIDDAEAQGHQAVTVAQAADAPLTLARAYALLARLAYRRAHHRTCIRYHQASLEQIRQIGHKQNEAVELSNLGLVYWTLRDYGRAIPLMQQGLEIYRQIGNRRGVIGAMDNLSGIYHEIGRYAEAQEAVEEGLAQARQIDFPHTEALLLVTRGRLYLDQGDIDAAERAIRQAQQIAQTIAAPYVSGIVHLALGMLWWAREDPARAERHFAQALQDCQAAGETDFATAARSFWALSQHALGNLERAVCLSTQAVTELEATPGGEHIQDIYLHHWHILRAAGRGEEARAALEKAYRSVQAQAKTLPDPEWRHDFLTKVPVNREIMAAWEAVQPRRVTFRLPAASAPTGRPLRDDEYVEVTWTIAAPEDDEIAGKVACRRHRLLRLLREAADQAAAPTVPALAAALDVSERTVKRDLAALRAAGHDVHTRGSR